MQTLLPVLTLVFAQLFPASIVPSEAPPPEDVPSVAEIVGMLDRVPAQEVGRYADRPGYYGRFKDARRIAEGIRAAVAHTPDARATAALMAVTVAFESAAHLTATSGACVGGDPRDGTFHAWGPYQLQNVPVEIACDPFKSARAWVQMARAVTCADNDPDEAMAALLSGSCDRGRAKARHRVEIARSVVEPYLD